MAEHSGSGQWGRIGTNVLAWLVVFLTGSVGVVCAREPLPPLEFGEPVPDAATPAELAPSSPSRDEPLDSLQNNPGHWLNKLAQSMTRSEPDKNSRSDLSVLSAFRDVVARPAKSTVRIWSREHQVALGAIVDSAGLIVTKASELKGPVECELSDTTRYDAELLDVDRGSDLALLKISARNLPVVRWSDDDPPAVGGWVVTPGLDDLPQAIGVVSVEPHRVRGGVLGIQMTEDQIGPRITFVVPESGAANAGLTRGDVITHIDGKRMKNSDAVIDVTSNSLPGEELDLTIQRGSEEQHVSAKLGSVASTLSSQRARFQDHLGGPLSQRRVLFPAALEHDSVLAPNQCGGALINLDGEVIGINIARASRIASYAIPARIARRIVDQLKSQAATAAATVPVATGSPEPQLSAAQFDR